ncbi:hypothetical protein ACRAWD_22670 [Caulobacter segnis]
MLFADSILRSVTKQLSSVLSARPASADGTVRQPGRPGDHAERRQISWNSLTRPRWTTCCWRTWTASRTLN